MPKVAIIMPAYNAARTLERTFNDIPKGSYDDIILVDDASKDKTTEISKRLGIFTIQHPKNRGYGGNQKTCYRAALDRGADIVIMLHPDYQYDPRAVPQIVELLASKKADFVIASRFAYEKSPYAQGMPLYKYIANRFLTTCQNAVFGLHLSEYHSGYRAYTRTMLDSIPFETFSDNFVFDSQMVAEAAARHERFAEIGIETRYFDEASQTSFRQSLRYGASTMLTLFSFLTHHRRRALASIIGLLTFASAIIWSLALPQGRPLGGDALEFHSLGISILEHGRFGGGEWFAKENPSMWREPGYPAFLALLYGIAGQSVWPLLIVQSALFALSAVLFFGIFTELAGPTAAGIAALLYAINPQFAFRAGYVDSDLPFVIAFSFFVWLFLTRRHTNRTILLSGVLLGIATLTRTISLLFPTVVLLYLFIQYRRTWYTYSALFVAGFLLVTLPWMIRNEYAFGSFALTNRSGLMFHSRAATLTLSSHDRIEFFTSSFLGDYVTQAIFSDYSNKKARYFSGLESRDYEVDLFVNKHLTPSTLDEKLKQEGLAQIQNHPIQYITDFIPNIARLNAPIIPRASAQGMFFDKSTSEKPSATKILFVILLRLVMYSIVLLALLATIYRATQGFFGWFFVLGILLYFNILYAAFAPVERFSMPLIPFYILGVIESIKIAVSKFQSIRVDHSSRTLQQVHTSS